MLSGAIAVIQTSAVVVSFSLLVVVTLEVACRVKFCMQITYSQNIFKRLHLG